VPSALELARAVESELIAIRRDLHQNPETAWQESRTSAKVADYCERLGLAVQRVAKTGVIATLNPGRPGLVMAFRADMDALPIQEETDLPFKAACPGKGHLCGHDAHTAMLLGAARILAQAREKIPFQVRFIFQPAEEVTQGGAELMLEENRLEGVSEIFGLHVNPLLPTGCLGLRSGPLMASMDRFEIEVEGSGGHGAMPHLTRDPVLAAAETIMALQAIVARRVDPFDSAVVSVCRMDAGSAFNVIPARAHLTGTARSLSRLVRERLPLWIEEIAVGVTAAHGQKAQVSYVHGTPVLVNPAEYVERMSHAFCALGGSVQEAKPTMGGEDFAFFLEKIPGCFGFLGASDGTPATSQCFHNPRFNLDERALAWGTALFVQLVSDKTGTNFRF